MSDKFEVRAGQTWRIKREMPSGETGEVIIKILDMFVSTALRDFTLFYRIEHTFDGETKKDALQIDLHEQFAEGWELIEEK